MFELVITAIETSSAIDLVFMHQKWRLQLLHTLDIRYLLQFTVILRIGINILLELLFQFLNLLLFVFLFFIESNQLVFTLLLGLF